MADELDESKLELPSFGLFGGSKGKRRAGKDDTSSKPAKPAEPAEPAAPDSSASTGAAEQLAGAEAPAASAPEAPTPTGPSTGPSTGSGATADEAAPAATTTRKPAPGRRRATPEDTKSAAKAERDAAKAERDAARTAQRDAAKAERAETAATSATAATADGSSTRRRGRRRTDSTGAAPVAADPDRTRGSSTSGLGEAMPAKPKDADEEEGSGWSLAPDSPGASLKDKLPDLTGQAAAAAAGAAVGLVGVLLVIGFLSGCEAIRNTSTCGAAGIPLLIAVLLLMVVLGRVLLGAWDVLDPSGTAFLAVALVAVISLLFFTNILLQWYMIVLLPLVSVAAHVLSYYVTTAFVEQDDDDYQKISTT